MAVWCVWLAVFVVCIGLEAASMALTSIWFAGGALIACVLSIAGVNLYIQVQSACQQICARCGG